MPAGAGVNGHDAAICFYCSEVIMRSEGGDWTDGDGYTGCGHRDGPHTPDDPNDVTE